MIVPFPCLVRWCFTVGLRCERTTELIDRLTIGIPDLTRDCGEQPRNSMDRQRRPECTQDDCRLDATPATERRPDQCQAPGPPSQPDTSRPGSGRRPQDLSPVSQERDSSTITNDADPEHWHIVAHDRAAWKSTYIRGPGHPTLE